MNILRLHHILPLSLLGAALVLTGCGSADPSTDANGNGNGERHALAIRTQATRMRPFERRLAVQGTLEAKHTALVGARTAGNVDAIWVDEGDPVTAGKTKLFQIDPSSLESALTIAQQDLAVNQASLAVAQASADKIRAEAKKVALDHERYTRLHAEGRISQSEFENSDVAYAQANAGIAVADAQVDLAQRQIEQAKASLAIAQKNLDDAHALAPLTGLISERLAEPGEHMSVGQTLLKIIDPATVEAAAFLPAQYYPDVVVGQTLVRLAVNGREAGTHPVTYRSPVVNPQLRTFEIKANVDAAHADVAVPGSMADIALVFETREALGVPSASVLVRGGQSIVFVIENNLAVLRVVETGLQNDGCTEILSGLTLGEQVAVEGQTQLYDGTLVDVQ